MAQSERFVKEWLEKKGYTDIRYNNKGSPDFFVAGRKIEVKRPVFGVITFTDKQLKELDEDTEIFIVEDKTTDPLIIHFSEILKCIENRQPLKIEKKSFKINIQKNTIIRIKVSPQTYEEWLDLCESMKKFGYDAERVLSLSIRLLKEQRRLGRIL